MPERTVQADGVELWTEDFGDPGQPTVLLISGGATQAIGWSDELIGVLVDGGRHVIRYDNRDVGLSTCVDFDRQPYTLADMAGDAVAVLDAYGVDRAHLVGPSMGGMIAQQVVIDHPERVRTVTCLCSSPAGASSSRAIFGLPAVDDLPTPSKDFLAAIGSALLHPPTTDEERIETDVKAARTLTGWHTPFDEAYVRDLFRRSLARARVPEAAANHARMATNAPDRRPQLRTLDVPMLVIHGTEDPVFPYEHGVALAEAVPGAVLHTIEGLGHELPPVLHQEVASMILTHTDGQ